MEISRTVLSAAIAFAITGCAVSPDGTEAPGPQNTQACVATSEADIASLFDRWNSSLQTGNPREVAANYAENSVLLATLSNKPRVTREEQIDYFEHFLVNKPSGKINSRTIKIDCNTAIDIGLYTFTLGKTGQEVKARYTFTYKWDGRQWLITTQHSSFMPEKE
ncbi:MAG: Calcium/calmodulin dependent protein kinase association-domain protein [Collimonas fungivorans]|uniref:SgcJ/EcaC family oxidoreductase n=1 Tax=Collimonas fungivorans TaxID=158899 RepID=UPI0026F08A25|nr:SgcJ/EcaC family oxidoreductase [Collimonas fungivorans]MDB5769406.1 Calcium/calmodulin dependent protein kinase association-domain protein [Collimonas fungivorans]